MNEGEINTIKLTSGEEVVAKIMKIEDGMLVVKQPVSIGPSPNGGAPMLMPSMFTAEMDRSVLSGSRSNKKNGKYNQTI